jgi:hypothetical protein
MRPTALQDAADRHHTAFRLELVDGIVAAVG